MQKVVHYVHAKVFCTSPFRQIIPNTDETMTINSHDDDATDGEKMGVG